MTFPEIPDLAAHTEAARHDNGLRHHPYGYVRSAADSRGRCGWRFQGCGIQILCWSYDLPGYGRCAHHLALSAVTP